MKKELSTDTCYSVDENVSNITIVKKPVTKDHILYLFSLYEVLKTGEGIETENRAAAWGWGSSVTGGGFFSA